MYINIIAVLKSSGEELDRICLFLQELVRHSRLEPGCLRYDAFRKNNCVIFVEVWESAQTLEAHQSGEHFQALLDFIRDVDAELEISVVEPV